MVSAFGVVVVVLAAAVVRCVRVSLPLALAASPVLGVGVGGVLR